MLSRIVPYLPLYPYLLAGLFGLSLVLLLAAVYNLWRTRTADVWRVRHDSGKRGGRLLVISLSMLGGTTVLSVFSGVIIVSFGYVNEFFPPRSTLDVSGVAITYLPTPTPTLVGVAASPTPNGAPLPTLPVIPTAPAATPVPTVAPLVQLGITIPQASQTPPAEAQLWVHTVANEINDAATPTGAADVLPVGTRQMHVIMDYAGMQNGVQWSWVLYREGAPVKGGAYLWTMGESGTHTFTLREAQGYPSGAYQLRLFLGQAPVADYAITVQ